MMFAPRHREHRLSAAECRNPRECARQAPWCWRLYKTREFSTDLTAPRIYALMFVDDERRSAGLWISQPEEEEQAAARATAEPEIRRAAPTARRAAEVSAAHHPADAA